MAVPNVSTFSLKARNMSALAALSVVVIHAGDGGMEFVFGKREFFHDTAVVVTGERVEALVYNGNSPTGVVVLIFGTVELEREAFLQVAGCDAGRVHLLNDMEDFFHFL